MKVLSRRWNNEMIDYFGRSHRLYQSVQEESKDQTLSEKKC